MAPHPLRATFATGSWGMGVGLPTATGGSPDAVPADSPACRTGAWPDSHAPAKASASAINPGISRDTVIT